MTELTEARTEERNEEPNERILEILTLGRQISRV